MEKDIVEYDYNKQNKMKELWVRWLRGKGHLHAETIAGIKDQWKSRNCSLVLERPSALASTQNWVDAYINLEICVGFNAEKAEPMTEHYPGSSASIEVNEIKLGELILPQEVFDEVMKQVQDEIEEACWDGVVVQLDYPNSY